MNVLEVNKLPMWVRVKYYNAVGGKCQLCHKPMEFRDMHVHRSKRGSKGGKYTIGPLNHPKQNCMMVHKKCHQLLHEGEPLRK